MPLRLVSIPGCPFVQRAAILLSEKRVPYQLDTVDLGAKPDWFLAISPRGRVPLLVVDGAVIFESAAICEYLEETHRDPPFYPGDALGRARDRGWCGFVNEELSRGIFQLLSAKAPEDREAAAAALGRAYTRLDEELAGREWLSGDGTRFGMVDAFAAPVYVRTVGLERAGLWSPPAGLGEIAAYGERLRARPSVVATTPPDLEERFRRKFGHLVRKD